MQIGADIGERSPGQGRLDEPMIRTMRAKRIGQDGRIVGDETAAVGCVPASLAESSGLTMSSKVRPAAASANMPPSVKKNVAPAEQVAEHAAHGLPEKLPRMWPEA